MLAEGEKSVEALAKRIADAHSRESSVLVLGSRAASAVGVPGIDAVARAVLGDLFKRDPSVAINYLSEETWALIQQKEQSDDLRFELVQAFYELLKSMSGIARRSMLRRFYSDFPIPQSYQDLARLIKDGYFALVLTASADTLLEQALDGIGFRRRDGYYAVDLVLDAGREVLLPSGDSGVVPIVKLHSGQMQSELATTLENIAATLGSDRFFVVVGYGFESEPVNQWLAQSAGDLWWVNPEHSIQDVQHRVGEERPVYIVEHGADLTMFFSWLKKTVAFQSSLRTVQDLKEAGLDSGSMLPATKEASVERRTVQQKSVSVGEGEAFIKGGKGLLAKDEAEPQGDETLVTRSLPDEEEPQQPRVELPLGKGIPTRDTLEQQKVTLRVSLDVAQAKAGGEVIGLKIGHIEDEPQFLREQLEMSRAKLSRLQQEQTAEGAWKPQLRSQIEYQKDRITQLEDRLRALPNTKFRVTELARKIAASVESAQQDPDAGLDSGVLSFLQSQVDVIIEECEQKEEPNQFVVGAAIGATVSLADRLGGEFVDPQDVRELAFFAPTTVMRGT